MIRLRFIFWFLALIATYISASTAPRTFPHFIIIFLILISIAGVLSLYVFYRHIHIKVFTEQLTITRDQQALWEMSITNHSKFNSIKLILNKEALLLAPLETHRLTYQQPVEHVGPVVFDVQLDLRLVDALGFFNKKITLPVFPIIDVIPFVTSDRSTAISPLLEGETTTHRSPLAYLAQEELDTIHPLQPNQPLKWIHWKLSARLQTWMVRTFVEDSSTKVLLILDSQPIYNLDQRDIYLDFVAYLMAELIQRSSFAGLVANQEKQVVDSIETNLTKLSRLPLEPKTTLENQLASFLDPSLLNLVVLSEPSTQRFEALLEYEIYFEQLQVILFCEDATTVDLPLALQGLSIIVLEYAYEPVKS